MATYLNGFLYQTFKYKYTKRLKVKKTNISNLNKYD